MANRPIPTREPVQIAAGDSIHFIRTLQNLPPTDGWALKYELTAEGNLTGIKFEFTSAAKGSGHEVTVTPETTKLWPSGEYQLTGFAENSGSDERAQFYIAPLIVNPNSEQEIVNAMTHAQKMLVNVEAQLEKISLHVVDESDIEGTRIKRQKIESLTNLRDYYLGERKNEIDRERARVGLPSRRRIRTRLNVTFSGYPSGPFNGSGFGGSGE